MVNTQTQNHFQFFIETEFYKKQKDTGTHRYIRGFASVPTEDREGEILDPMGFNIQPLLEYGWINWEHKKDKIVGIPIEAKISPQGLYIEAELLDTAEGNKVWELAQALNKTDKRNLGFSVEGKVLERDKENPQKIKRAIITDIAVTLKPVNPNTTFEIFSKALLSGYELANQSGGGALRFQDLDNKLATNTYDITPPPIIPEEKNNANGGEYATEKNFWDLDLNDYQAFMFLKQFCLPEKFIRQIIEYTKAKRST